MNMYDIFVRIQDIHLGTRHNYLHCITLSFCEMSVTIVYEMYNQCTLWRGRERGRIDIQGSSFLNINYLYIKVSFWSHKDKVVKHKTMQTTTRKSMTRPLDLSGKFFIGIPTVMLVINTGLY